MVIIGGMRSLLGPALGALFYILFREYLSIWTPQWLWFFGLLFVGFIVFSPSGLVGVWQRLTAPWRKREIEAAAMSGRAIEHNVELPAFTRAHAADTGTVLEVEHFAKSFGGIHAVRDASVAVGARSLHALIGPNGAGKTTLFNLISGLIAPDRGRVVLKGRDITHAPPYRIVAAGVARSFSNHQSVSGAERAGKPASGGAGARTEPIQRVVTDHSGRAGNAGNRATDSLSGTQCIERAEAGALSYGGQRLLDMGLALACAPRVLLLDEPLAGLAAAERERVSQLIKRIAFDLPVLLVEHDIDRVFALADHVTVMNDGKVLFDGNAGDARASQAVREIYIGSGTAALAATASKVSSAERLEANALLSLEAVDTFYARATSSRALR